MEKGCPSCGRMIDGNFSRCPYCNYDFSQLNTLFQHYQEEAAIKVPKYTGFIKRLVANTIDFWILLSFILIIQLGYLYFLFPEFFTSYDLKYFSYGELFLMFIPCLCLPIIYFFYCVFCQHSKQMATLGEKLLKIEVVNNYEEPITWREAFGRNLARILNILTLGIGFLIIIVTKKKQALSDIVSKTLVINKVTDENYNEFSYAHLARRLLAFIIDVAVLGLIVMGFQYLKDYIADLHLDYRTEILTAFDYLMYIILVLYFPWLEKKFSASIGKKIMHIKVIKLNGEKVGFIRSFLRLISYMMECLLVPFGILLAFVTPRKQTLKDIITKTIVVNNR